MNSLVSKVMDQLIEQIEKGVNPWKRSWQSGLPVNVTTDKRYRGINVVLLWMAEVENGYASGEWGSMKQFGARGYRVKEAELKKSTRIVFFRKLDKKDADGNVVYTKDGRARQTGMLRVGWVFNVAQLENWTAAPAAQYDYEGRHIEAQRIVDALGVTLVHGEPAYQPLADRICMPITSKFDSLDAYYSTLFHEVAHWTGHGSRLARPGIMVSRSKESKEYAAEELIAEISAAFLNAHTGLSTNTHADNSASYLSSWLKTFDDKREALYAASKDAGQVLDYVTTRSQQQELAA